MRQTMTEHQKGPTGLLLGDQALDLRNDLRFPRRNILGFLAVLVLDVRNPHAVEIRRRGRGAMQPRAGGKR